MREKKKFFCLACQLEKLLREKFFYIKVSSSSNNGCCYSTTTMIMQVDDDCLCIFQAAQMCMKISKEKKSLMFIVIIASASGSTYTYTHAKHSVTEQKKRKTYFTQKWEKTTKIKQERKKLHRCDVENFYREIVNQHGDNDDAQKFLLSHSLTRTVN